MSCESVARICAALIALSSCGGARPVATRPVVPAATPKGMQIVRDAGRPALAIVWREGDPTGAVGAFVATAGIAPERGAVVPVALAGLFASRLPGARVTPQGDGVRIAIAGGDIAKLGAALVLPANGATDFGLAQRKVAALGALPRVASEEMPIAACEGELVGGSSEGATVSPADVEAWRAAAVTRGRVAFALIARSGARVRAPRLPEGSAAAAIPDAPELAVHEAADAPRGARVAIAWRGDARLVPAARALGDPSGPLAALLAASDTHAHVRSVTTALSSQGACLSLRADVDADAKSSAGAARIAELVELATREARRAAAAGSIELAPDPTDAAEQAALLAAYDGGAREPGPPRVVVQTSGDAGVTRDAIAAAETAAKRAFAERAVESRVQVERGQPSNWILLASPCGTAGESDGDAGASAAFAMATATALRARGIAAEPWTAADGVGLIASATDARALGDVLGRVVLVDPVEGARAAQARLLDAARPGLSALAEAIAPGRPASVLPTGTPPSLVRLSDAAIVARADALRRGPLRVIVLANDDAVQGEAAVASIDRWALREGARTCPARAEGSPPKPGTYAVQTEDGTSEAYLAAPVAPEQESAAETLASALDGEGGLLDKALGDGLARAWSARVLGRSGERALVVHVDAPAEALDAAVAQVRALFDRLRQGALAQADVARANERSEQARAIRMRDPRERLLALFRADTAPPSTRSGARAAPPSADPATDRARAAAAAIFRDDALVIVAARPRGALPLPTPKKSP